MSNLDQVAILLLLSPYMCLNILISTQILISRLDGGGWVGGLEELEYGNVGTEPDLVRECVGDGGDIVNKSGGATCSSVSNEGSEGSSNSDTVVPISIGALTSALSFSVSNVSTEHDLVRKCVGDDGDIVNISGGATRSSVSNDGSEVSSNSDTVVPINIGALMSALSFSVSSEHPDETESTDSSG